MLPKNLRGGIVLNGVESCQAATNQMWDRGYFNGTPHTGSNAFQYKRSSELVRNRCPKSVLPENSSSIVVGPSNSDDLEDRLFPAELCLHIYNSPT